MADDQSENAEFQFGANLDSTVYDKAEVFEPLSYGSYSGSGLPPRISLKEFAPQRGYQGSQGSCVGWATSYAARTILHASVTKQDPDQSAFSPSYLYNQIALSGCQGAYMRDAMEVLTQKGTLQFREFPYNEGSCSARPNANQQSKAQNFRIKGYNRLTLGANNYTPDMEGIKQHLAQGSPVVIGMQVGGSFMSQMRGQKVWQPTRRDYSMYGYSGHAMTVIGYDDQLEGGAFEIMNSWGEAWGREGIGWVKYNDFAHFTKEAYGLYPMGNTEQYDPNKLAV
ncbi:MAG: C1 family peptidase, partial [Bacteroidota bacterium]